MLRLALEELKCMRHGSHDRMPHVLLTSTA
jgi:hypothetical protein